MLISFIEVEIVSNKKMASELLRDTSPKQHHCGHHTSVHYLWPYMQQRSVSSLAQKEIKIACFPGWNCASCHMLFVLSSDLYSKHSIGNPSAFAYFKEAAPFC